MDSDLLSKTNKQRIANLRALAARYEQMADLAKDLDWSPSYLSQLIGPKPSRAISERTARQVELKLGLDQGVLDRELSTVTESAVAADLIDTVMLTVDSALRTAEMKLPEEKYRALVSHLYRTAIRRKEAAIPREEVDSLIRLIR